MPNNNKMNAEEFRMKWRSLDQQWQKKKLTIDQLNEKQDALTESYAFAKAEEVLMKDKAWSLIDIIQKLSEVGKILLHNKPEYSQGYADAINDVLTDLWRLID